MTKLGGWAGLPQPSQVASTALARIAREGTPQGTVDATCWQLDQCAIAAAGDTIDAHQDDGAYAVLIGRPHWTGAGGTDGSAGLARRALDGYRTAGIDILNALGGTFALALTLDKGQTALLAIDRIGVTSLTWRAIGRGLVFGTTADDVNAFFDAPREIDHQSLYNYVFLHMVPGPATIFRGESRIPPGGYVELKDGSIASGHYWKMRYDERARADFPALKVEFRALLDRSVKSLVDHRAVGTFLSGGTDSSTITGVLAAASNAPVRTYSIGFEAQGYDEMEYARIAARHFATDHHEYYVTPDDVVALAPRLAAFCDQPFGNASAVPTYYCAAFAKSDGVELLLGGDGGDELFGGNERYATQALFSWYAKVPSAVRKGLIEPLLFGIPGGDRIGLLRRGRSYVAQTSVSVPRRLHAYNMLRRTPLDTVFSKEFLAQVDPATPLNLLEGVYQSADATDPLNRMLAMDLQFTLADNDLYKVNRMCALAGVDVAYPLLDDELVAFSARLPARLKLKGTRLRYFFKQALLDLLPKEIIHKQKHGFGLPIGIWIQTHQPLRDLAYDAVRAFGARGIVRPEFADQVISEHKAGDAAYWGGEIWSLSQLELWLQAHGWAAGKPLL